MWGGAKRKDVLPKSFDHEKGGVKGPRFKLSLGGGQKKKKNGITSCTHDWGQREVS